MKYKIITCFLIAIIFTAIGSIITYKFMDSKFVEKKIYIKGETKTIYKAIKIPSGMAELTKAAESPIEIIGKINVNNILDVTASDGFKQSSKGFKLGSRGNWRLYLKVAGIVVLTGGACYGGYRLYKKYK